MFLLTIVVSYRVDTELTEDMLDGIYSHSSEGFRFFFRFPNGKREQYEGFALKHCGKWFLSPTLVTGQPLPLLCADADALSDLCGYLRKGVERNEKTHQRGVGLAGKYIFIVCNCRWCVGESQERAGRAVHRPRAVELRAGRGGLRQALSAGVPLSEHDERSQSLVRHQPGERRG